MDPKSIPPISEFIDAKDLQIRFNDVDVLGHINNTVYFSFFDTGKAAFFEKVLGERVHWNKVECVIANIDCAFVAPVFFGEKIQVLTRCLWIHDKSFCLQQALVERNTLELKACADTIMVSIDPETKLAVPVSEKYRTALQKSMKIHSNEK